MSRSKKAELWREQIRQPSQKSEKKASTPEETTIRRQNLEHAFNQRRDAVCEEIERTWIVERASLQIHRLMNSANSDLCCHKKRIPRGNFADFDLNARNH